MVSHLVRYKGLKMSQSHPWDQACARSPEKDVGHISSYYIDKVPARISMHNSKKGFILLRLGKILSSYQRSMAHVERGTLQC